MVDNDVKRLQHLTEDYKRTHAHWLDVLLKIAGEGVTESNKKEYAQCRQEHEDAVAAYDEAMPSKRWLYH